MANGLIPMIAKTKKDHKLVAVGCDPSQTDGTSLRIRTGICFDGFGSERAPSGDVMTSHKNLLILG